MEKNYNLESGFFSLKDRISPAYINVNNPKYVEIDGVYYSGFIIANYNREFTDIIFKRIIDTNINMNISIFYEKQDSYKAIKDLTYNIANTGVEISGENSNKEDVEIAAFTHNDAKYIRREIQINNEDIYFLYVYLIIFSREIGELEYLENKIEGILQSSGLITKRATFREEQAFLTCMPIMKNHKDLKNAARRNVLTSALIGTYPFITSTKFDEKGIFFGTNIYNESLIFIDKYDTEKYKNANMCVFGTSGSGKSFFIKLQIIRYKLLGIEQYVIDPEREYLKLGENLNGAVIKIGPNSKTYVNIMEIREDSTEDETGYLATKINKLLGFFSIIFGSLDEEERAILEEKTIICYKEKGITFDDKSLYINDKENINIKPIFKGKKEMPILQDLYNVLGQDKKTRIFQKKLKPFVLGTLKFFNNYSNIELNNDLIIADIFDLGEENIKYGMYLFMDLFWDKVKRNRKIRKTIYLDEVWKLIGVTSNKDVAGFIYKIFKTIRKYGGSSVAITQDVSDLFSLEDGVYGKSILNNSSTKVFFSLEEENIKLLSEYTNLSEKEKIEIKTLKRGECLIFSGDEHILSRIEGADFEKEIIE